MGKVTRTEIFAQAAKRMRQEFKELSSIIPHNAVKGGEAEKLVRKFLSDHIPKRFDVGSGFVIDPQDTVSRQTDVIVYDAHNCPVYRASEDAAIFPSQNVAAVVEVKSRITRDSLYKAFRNIAETKSLKKRGMRGATGPDRTQTYGCIFAFGSDLSLDTISQTYVEYIKEFGLGRHPDLMLVLDKAVFSLSAYDREASEWNTATIEGFGGAAGEGSHLAVSYATTGEQSLDYFIRLLLANLLFFRSAVDHPGFDFKESPAGGKAHTRYLTTITCEQDPAKKKRKLKEYEMEVRRIFDELPASEPTIYLPSGDLPD